LFEIINTEKNITNSSLFQLFILIWRGKKKKETGKRKKKEKEARYLNSLCMKSHFLSSFKA